MLIFASKKLYPFDYFTSEQLRWDTLYLYKKNEAKKHHVSDYYYIVSSATTDNLHVCVYKERIGQEDTLIVIRDRKNERPFAIYKIHTNSIGNVCIISPVKKIGLTIVNNSYETAKLMVAQLNQNLHNYNVTDIDTVTCVLLWIIATGDIPEGPKFTYLNNMYNIPKSVRFWEDIQLNADSNPKIEFHNYYLTCTGIYDMGISGAHGYKNYIKIYNSFYNDDSKTLIRFYNNDPIFACLASNKTSKIGLAFRDNAFGRRLNLSHLFETQLNYINDWVQQLDITDPNGMILAFLATSWGKDLPEISELC